MFSRFYKMRKGSSKKRSGQDARGVFRSFSHVSMSIQFSVLGAPTLSGPEPVRCRSQRASANSRGSRHLTKSPGARRRAGCIEDYFAALPGSQLALRHLVDSAIILRMAEFLPIDPEDLVKEVVEKYSLLGGTSVWSHPAVVVPLLTLLICLLWPHHWCSFCPG